MAHVLGCVQRLHTGRILGIFYCHLVGSILLRHLSHCIADLLTLSPPPAGYRFTDIFACYFFSTSSYPKPKAPVFYTSSTSTHFYRTMRPKSTSLSPARTSASNPQGSHIFGKLSTILGRGSSACPLPSLLRLFLRMSARKAIHRLSSRGLASLPPNGSPAAPRVAAIFIAFCPAQLQPPAVLGLPGAPQAPAT